MRRLHNCDLCIDALLGIGSQSREPAGLDGRLDRTHQQPAVPRCWRWTCPPACRPTPALPAAVHVKASHTLSLLTLKPGLVHRHRAATWQAQSGWTICKPDQAVSERTATLASQRLAGRQADWHDRDRMPATRAVMAMWP